ncbi:MAG TPA: extracellular solute-binding protein [Actinoplanes sp.]|nr:extracellular solute-binding protein [Actinoplanes sp.]
MSKYGIALFTVGLLALAGCADSGSAVPEQPAAAVTQAEIDKAMTTPTTLTYWTWVPGIEDEIALFQKKYPAIEVNVVNAGQGLAHYQKLRTALKAGSGFPDVAQVEFQSVSTFSITKDLLDLRPYGAEEAKAKFVDSAVSQVTGGQGQIWAYPQDSGPLEMLYRKDIFDKYGITVPTTWAEFATAAEKLHAAAPDVSMTNLASGQGVAYMGLLWQAGAAPHQVTGDDSIDINFTDDTSKKVADYWTALNKTGAISTDPDFTDAWYQGLARGKYATWLTGSWAPAFLQSNAASSSGKWRVAKLPQWNAGEKYNGGWGGSTIAVMAKSTNPIAAAKLAEFLGSDPDVALMYTEKQQFFPATKATLANAEWKSATPEFYGGQKVNEIGIEASDEMRPFSWSPFQDQVYSYWQDSVGKALADKSDLWPAVQTWEKETAEYAADQGFKVQ